MAIAPGILTALILVTMKSAGRFRTAMANRRAVRQLGEWSARELKDIGLTPGDVRGALALPLHEDPTTFLSLIAAGRDIRPRRDSAGRHVPSGIVPAATRLGSLPTAEPALCA